MFFASPAAMPASSNPSVAKKEAPIKGASFLKVVSYFNTKCTLFRPFVN